MGGQDVDVLLNIVPKLLGFGRDALDLVVVSVVFVLVIHQDALADV